MKIILVIFIFLFNNDVLSQSRWYSDRIVTSAYSPAVNGGWTITTGNTYVALLASKVFSSGGAGTITSGQTGGSAIREIITQTMIGPPLAAQTIATSSTISAQFKTSMSSTSSRSGRGKVYVRLMNEDGTIASEIGSAVTANLTTTSTNRTYSLTLGSNVVVTGGQRIVFEFGWEYLTGSNTTTTGSVQSVSGPNAADLPVDNTTTTSLVCWVEFSQTLVLASGYTAGVML